jgi:hypothetical protein
MIPTAILLGLIAGLIPRYRWWSIPVIGVIWSILLSAGGDPSMSFAQIWIVGFMIGALNGALGVAFTWAVATSVHAVYQWIRQRRVAQ